MGEVSVVQHLDAAEAAVLRTAGALRAAVGQRDQDEVLLELLAQAEDLEAGIRVHATHLKAQATVRWG